jgi:outer membrane scaffolding protein for murein synthesis (MipA/OmpV family)
MMNMKKFVVLPALLFASVSVVAVAHAQDEDESKWGGNIILGAGLKPEYEGSEDYEATPLAAGKLEYGQYYLEARGTDLRANVLSVSHIEFGPSVSFKGGRDDVDNEFVNRMRDIDDTVEVGAFVKVPLRQVFDNKDEFEFEVEFLTDTGDVHEGYKVKLGLSYKYALTEKFRLGTSLSATYASDDYNQTYFGIDADSSARSGLPQYEAEAGFKDVGVGVNALYRLNENWGVTGIAQYKQLIGDAADSPVVDKEGSAGQAMVGVGILYRF